MKAIKIKNNTVEDNVLVEVPITQKEYKTNIYHAWASGYNPSLDSIHTFIPTTTIHIKHKAKHWGLSL